ncbi:hypothetical protein ACFLZ6_02165, partial [Nanoarchaeota archaeon]
MRQNNKKYLRYFFLVLFLFMLVLSFLIVKPFLITVLTSILISYVFYPLYAKINKKLKINNLSAT